MKIESREGEKLIYNCHPRKSNCRKVNMPSTLLPFRPEEGKNKKNKKKPNYSTTLFLSYFY